MEGKFQEEPDEDWCSFQVDQADSDEELHSCEENDAKAKQEVIASGSSAVGKRSARGNSPAQLNDYVVDIAMAEEAEPSSYGEAVAGPENDWWTEALREEFQSLINR